MSTLKVNKLRDTAGSADAITLDPNGGAVLAGVTTVTSVKVGAAVTISESGIEASGIGITCANINGGQIGGRRNIIINGAMQVWQRATSTTDIGGSNGYFACDRYRSSNNGAARYTMSRSTDTPNGFGYSMKIDVTTANASPSAANYVFIQHRIEGQDVQGFAKGSSEAKTFALSFHVKSPKTGTHIMQLEDVGNTRSVSKSYTVNAANTWEKKTILFPADTTGAITADSENRLQLYIWLMAGSTYNAGSLATTWGTTVAATRGYGQVNVFDSTSNDFYITGIQLEVGSQATAFEHRSFSEELSLCQRYYYRVGLSGGNYYGGDLGIGFTDNDDTNIYVRTEFTTQMREAPTAVEQTGDASEYKVRRDSTKTCSGVPTFSQATAWAAKTNFPSSSHGWGTAAPVWGQTGNSDSFLAWSAEL